MLNLPDMTTLRAAIEHEQRPDLKRLLEERLGDTIHSGLEENTHVLVVEADDTEEQIVEAVGFSPLRTRIDNLPGSDWDWLERHAGWFELLYCVGDSGFAYFLLVEDSDRSPLAELCRREAGR